MQTHSFRQRIVSGSFTLPVMALTAMLCWVLPGPADARLWAGFGMAGIATYLIMELNNRYSLLRIRSRMISTTFLLLTALCPSLHDWSVSLILPLLLILSYFMLFSSYQNARPEGYIYHAFLFASLGSLLFPPMLLLSVSFLFSMLFQLRSFTGRTLIASLLGILTPYWIYGAWAIWNNKLDTMFLYLPQWLRVEVTEIGHIPAQYTVTIGTLLFFALCAFVHFFHTAYNDKIRTRMLFYVLATQEVILTAGLLVYSRYTEQLLGLFIVNSAFFIAHYYALGRGRFFNLWFNLSLLALTALGIWNYVQYFGGV